MRRLWAYRQVLPAWMRLPAVPPWDGEEPRILLGRARGGHGENRTPRIREQTMQVLLAWAIRFVEDFAQDIVAAFHEYEGLRA